MSQDEVDELVRIGGYATKSVKSIQLPETVDKDGPAGISGTLVGGESGTSYPPEVVLASTWNDDLSEEFGKCIGEDSLAHGVMVSMNRIGSRWTGGHYGLMTATLRDEWGFKGMAVTDQASYAVFAYEDMRG